MEKVFKEGVVGIYQNQSYSVEEGSFYYLTHLFDEKGHLDYDQIVQLYNDQYTHPCHGRKSIGPFESLEELNKFSFKLCEEFDFSFISLISSGEYNAVLESVVDADELLAKLVQSGNILENIDRGKKSIFKKLFH